MDVAINVEQLSKKYILGSAATGDLRSAISNLFSIKNRVEKEVFWALKDVSFEVKKGEVLGVVGANGAGKSTLLKILSQITYPTSGSVSIKGRVASLLEVGTGFHPELTGRENVFLNGTLLGMRRQEIKSKFDEIVDFSGVEKFIDTPVKHYSSGMYVRLAFAVAAHLEPEILLVDEVLAVGDASFREKSLNKLKNVANGGRTVVFVSHNLSAINSLCSRAILLKKGELLEQGQTSEVISSYLRKKEQLINFSCTLYDVFLTKQKEHYKYDEDVAFTFVYKEPLAKCIVVSISCSNFKQERIFISEYELPVSEGVQKMKITIPKYLLLEGNYLIDLNLKDSRRTSFLKKDSQVISFSIINRSPIYNQYKVDNLGYIADPLQWEIIN